MAVEVPYTWTPASSTTLPGTGRWYLDIAPTPDLYRPVPHWRALDFVRSRSGTLCAVIAGPHNDGLRSVLKSYVFDSADPEADTAEVSIETDGASAAAVGQRPGGNILDLLYVHGGAVKHRRSLDYGRSWESAASITIPTAGGNLVPTELVANELFAPGAGTIFDTWMTFTSGGLTFGYRRGGGLVLLVSGDPGGAADLYIGLLEWNGSAWAAPGDFTSWTDGTFGHLELGASGILEQPHYGTRFRRFSRDGTYQHVTGVLGGSGNAAAHGGRPAMIVAGPYTPVTGAVDPPGYFRYWWSVAGLDAGGADWVNTGTSRLAGDDSNEARFRKAWMGAWTHTGGSTKRWQCRGGRMRRRRDGSWEWMYLRDDQVPVIERCRMMPSTAYPASWS